MTIVYTTFTNYASMHSKRPPDYGDQYIVSFSRDESLQDLHQPVICDRRNTFVSNSCLYFMFYFPIVFQIRISRN